MLHSFSHTSSESQSIYVTLDGPYSTPENELLLEDYVRKLFPSASFSKNRLETFEDWKAESDSIRGDIDFIILNTNHDHVYLHEDSVPLDNILVSASKLSLNLAAISHWPEAMSRSTWKFGSRSSFKLLVSEMDWIIGTCAVSKNLFNEWWEMDFTGGKRIVRPDNPFGPWVRFKSQFSIVPEKELVRHLDGYGHTNIYQPATWTLRPCCVVEGNAIQHDTWTIGNLEGLIGQRFDLSRSISDLDPEQQDECLDYLKAANAVRIRLASSARILEKNGYPTRLRVALLWRLIFSKFAVNRLAVRLAVQLPAEIRARFMQALGSFLEFRNPSHE